MVGYFQRKLVEQAHCSIKRSIYIGIRVGQHSKEEDDDVSAAAASDNDNYITSQAEVDKDITRSVVEICFLLVRSMFASLVSFNSLMHGEFANVDVKCSTAPLFA